MNDLKASEVSGSVDPNCFPPILTPIQAAKLMQIERTTLYRWVSQGRLRSCVRRGKPLRFWRDRLVSEFFLKSQP